MVRERGSSCQSQAVGFIPTSSSSSRSAGGNYRGLEEVWRLDSYRHWFGPKSPFKLQSIYPEYSRFIPKLYQYRERTADGNYRRGLEISSYNKSRKLLGRTMRPETRGHCINRPPKRDSRYLLRTYCGYFRCSYSDWGLQKRSSCASHTGIFSIPLLLQSG